MTVAQDKTSVGAGSMEWQTPPGLFAWLNRQFQFDYDPFASHENALLPLYSTVEGTYERCDNLGYRNAQGPNHYLRSEASGLEHDWTDLRVFMNPPYSRGLVERCIEKAYNERNNAAIIVALIPASTETHWFQHWILPVCHIEWLPKRVAFIHPPFACGPKCQTGTKPHKLGEPGDGPAAGSVVAIFRQDY